MMMIPKQVTVVLKVIEQGEDVHREQQSDAPCVEHITADNNDDIADNDEIDGVVFTHIGISG